MEESRYKASQQSSGARRRQRSDTDLVRSSKRRVKVFDETQTEEERRLLRVEQRNINHTLTREEYRTRSKARNEEDDELGDTAMEAEVPMSLEGVRDNNNLLFKAVSYTRELVLDAENVDLLASKYAKEVEKSIQVPRYDPLKFINTLKRKCTAKSGGNPFFDWKTLGIQTGLCFNAVPSKVVFVAGKYDQGIVAKERAPRRERVRDTSDEVKPEEQVKQTKSEQATMSVADVSVAKLKSGLRKEYRERQQSCAGGEKPDPLDGLDILLDPNSFTKTVENFFYFSFLIKKGEAQVKKGWKVSPVQPDPDGPPRESRQAFVHINKKIWKKMCEARRARDGCLHN